MSAKYIIRTSDRSKFKECRRAWDWSSKIRQNLEPARLPIYLDFGTAMHSGMETYYDPNTWFWDREVVQGLSVVSFVDSMKKSKAKYLAFTERESLPEDMQVEYDTHIELGQGMLANYFKWGPEHDKFTPVYAEIEFEVPIKVPENMHEFWSMPPAFKVIDQQLWFNGPEGLGPVVYQGRIDLIVQDEYGNYWVLDHKTAGQLREDTLLFLELDQQTGSYCWALQEQLHIPIQGAIYSELYKGVPAKPTKNQRPYKGCWFSVNKQQDTTYELYLDTVREEDPGGFAAGYYNDFLDYLKSNGKTFFRRSACHRSQVELENLGAQICLEAMDMLDNPRIYPDPTKYKCNNCWFRSPCLAANDGSDVQWILDNNYRRRS